MPYRHRYQEVTSVFHGTGPGIDVRPAGGGGVPPQAGPGGDGAARQLLWERIMADIDDPDVVGDEAALLRVVNALPDTAEVSPDLRVWTVDKAIAEDLLPERERADHKSFSVSEHKLYEWAHNHKCGVSAKGLKDLINVIKDPLFDISQVFSNAVCWLGLP